MSEHDDGEHAGSTPSAGERPVLVPIAVLEGQTIPQAVIELCASVPVVVLGYHVLPDQTAPGQARMQFEERAQDELDGLADAFDAAGGVVETRLAFTHDADQTIERVALDERCRGVLLVNPAQRIERVLVALRGHGNVRQVNELAVALFANTDVDVTFYHVAHSETDHETGQRLVAAAADLMAANGVSRDRITAQTVVSDAPVRTLIDAADDDYDFVIIGETKPTLRERIVGETPQRIAERSLEPVLVVRRVRGRARTERDSS